MEAICGRCNRTLTQRLIRDPNNPNLVTAWRWTHRDPQPTGATPPCRHPLATLPSNPRLTAFLLDLARRLADPELQRVSKEGTSKQFVDKMFDVIFPPRGDPL